MTRSQQIIRIQKHRVRQAHKSGNNALFLSELKRLHRIRTYKRMRDALSKGARMVHKLLYVMPPERVARIFNNSLDDIRIGIIHMDKLRGDNLPDYNGLIKKS